MRTDRTRCLILACGNTLRGDDGVGPWLAQWASQHFRSDPRVQVICRQQWAPELAEDIAGAEAVIFVDSAVALDEREITAIQPVVAAERSFALTHSFDAGTLLALAHECYGARPRDAVLLAVRAYRMELCKDISAEAQASLPAACALLEKTVAEVLT